MRASKARGNAVAVAAALLVCAAGVGAWVIASTAAPPPQLPAPSVAGLNYGFPHTIDGRWVGTEWLRPDAAGGSWDETEPALAADLDFIDRRGLGSVMRLFIGLDQAMVWDSNRGFVGFDEPTLQHLGAALDLLDARGMKAIAVVYDQEQVSSRGNFHVEALDGDHVAMRQAYLRATQLFMRRFGSRSTVVGWDLFNEAYNSLGVDGHLPRPPHADPISPGYPDATVHAWLADLYRAARAGAPTARLTVSDTTELYWNPQPDLAKYEDVVDFYDIHVYDDNPRYPNWRALLRKPYIVGEAGASTVGGHVDDQGFNSRAVTYLLEHAQAAGVSFVLVQGRAFGADRRTLTPTGATLSQFLVAHPGPPVAAGPNAGDTVAAALLGTARRVKRFLGA